MTLRRHLRTVGALVAFTTLGSLTLSGLPLQAEDTGTQQYDDAFYGDEYAGDNDEYNYGAFGYDDRDQGQDYENAYSGSNESGVIDNRWWENSPYYNEDEWYDPTDWFDGNNYEYESSDDSYRYDTTYANDREDNYYNYDYDDEYGDEVYDYGYEVGDDEGDESYDAGYDYEYYDDPPP